MHCTLIIRQKISQQRPALDERLVPDVLAVEHHEVEGDDRAALAFAGAQSVEILMSA